MKDNTEIIEALAEELATAIATEMAGDEGADLPQLEGRLYKVMQPVGLKSLIWMLEEIEEEIEDQTGESE